MSKAEGPHGFSGRVAVVTGAASGIGQAIAGLLAERGAAVAAVDIDREAGEAAAETIRGADRYVTFLQADVSQAAECRRVVDETLRFFGRLDVLVNNAGANIPEPFVEVSEEHLDTLLALNVRAAFLVAQAAAKKMLEAPDRKTRGGAILNMSSQMGHVGAVNRTVYCMTKHAVEGLTKAMALELAPHGIRVLSIAPTFIDTPMYRQMAAARPDFAQWVQARIPAGRLGQAEDVAAAVVFAASGAASLMTGTSLVVDGGWTAQ